MRAAVLIPCVVLAAVIDAAEPAVRYVANSGMLVMVDGRRFLIDAPIRDGIPPYPTSPPDERSRLERARAPYDDVDAVLVTHWHEDHFDAQAVAAHLAHNPRAVFISSPEVVERLRGVAASLPPARVRAVLPPPGRAEEVPVGGVAVRVLRIRHNPARRLPEQHVGFLIGNTAHVLHVGDADPKADNFALLQGLAKVDVALLPYWYVLDEATRRLVSESIRPARIVAMHLPAGEAQEASAALAKAGIPVSLPTEPGAPVVFDR